LFAVYKIEVLGVHVSRAFLTPLYRGVFCIAAGTMFASQNATRIAADRRDELRACLASRLGDLATAEIGGAARLLGIERSGASRRTTLTLGVSARE
jgi:hypothetical protein